MRWLHRLRQFKQACSPYQPLVEVRIFKSALLHNLRAFQAIRPLLQIAPVLKSNAYGHGLREVARIFDSEPVPFFCVDSPYEAIILRNDGIQQPILVLDYTRPHNIARLKLGRVSYAVIDLEQLKELARTIKRPCKIHLKIDTGMHRQGIAITELVQAINLIKKQPYLELEGIFSHLADPVNHSDFTATQIEVWHSALRTVIKEVGRPRYYHIGATSGFSFRGTIESNVARVGIGIYGVAPYLGLPLKPALELATSITSIKTVPKGEWVGYNLAYQATQPQQIATLPLGYFEGLDLRLTNRGLVKIQNQFCPIVGRVSMNLTSLDVSSLPQAAVGQRAVVISADPTDPNSIQHIAEQCATIPYEIMAHIPPHLRRIVV